MRLMKRTRKNISKKPTSLFSLVRRLWKFAIVNYFITIFFACIVFVGVVSVYKLFFAKDTYVYTRVKVSQGLWWANTAKPSIWMLKAFKKGDVEKSLTGKQSVKILAVRYYPYWGTDQFDVYLDLKLLVSGNPKTGKYNFKRSAIGVGAPIDLEFPDVQVSGTITRMSSKPFKDKTVKKTLTLVKKYANAWEYDAIQIGDSYFDGTDKVFTVMDKWFEEQWVTYEATGNNYPIETEPKKHITVRAEVLLTQSKNQLFFAQEQKLTLGKAFNMSTNNFTFEAFEIAGIE